jgi:hypothetical protein
MQSWTVNLAASTRAFVGLALSIGIVPTQIGAMNKGGGSMRFVKRTKHALKKRTPKERIAAKALLSKGEILPEVRKELLDEHAPERVCYVCERTGRDMQMIAADKHRCEGCSVGSPNWLDYWERLREKDPRKATGKFMYDAKRGNK